MIKKAKKSKQRNAATNVAVKPGEATGLASKRIKLHWFLSPCAWNVTTEPSKHISLKQQQKAVATLARRLLTIGGHQVCVQFADFHKMTALIAKEGHDFHGVKVKLVKGDTHNCHTNTARLWAHHKDQYLLMTGYALCDEGIWRRHSWLLDDQSLAIIETTEKMEEYFGAAFPADVAETFCKEYINNIPKLKTA